MIGSQGKRMLRISLPHEQSWNAWLCPVASNSSLRENVDTACLGVGVEPSTIERTVSIIVDQSGRHEVPARMDADTAGPLSGSPEEIAAGLPAFADEGIRHTQIYLVSNTLESIERFQKVLEAMGRKSNRCGTHRRAGLNVVWPFTCAK